MSRYAEAHANPQGPGDSRPTALQIIEDEGVKGKLVDKVIVITGVSSGIGIETVRALSTTGARFFLTARDLDKARTALAGIFDPDRMEFVKMDLGSLQDVRTAAKHILSKTNKINILINNAGIMAVPNLEFTQDGFELQFGTNHLSHFLLFQLLKPALLAAVTPDHHSRVVIVASSAHLINGINDSDNYNYEKGGYDAVAAYAQSKTANIYTANEIERQYGPQGLHATSLHPGGIMTGLTRYMTDEALQAATSAEGLAKIIKTPEQGAATTVWAAIGKEWKDRGGRYLSDCTEAGPSQGQNSSTDQGYAKWAYDPEKEARLWNDSLKLVDLA